MVRQSAGKASFEVHVAPLSPTAATWAGQGTLALQAVPRGTPISPADHMHVQQTSYADEIPEIAKQNNPSPEAVSPILSNRFACKI